MTDIEILSAKARTFLSTAVAQDEAEELLEAAKDFVRSVKNYLDQWAQKEGRQ